MRYLRLGIAILFIAGIGTASAYDRADYPHWSDLDDDGLDTVGHGRLLASVGGEAVGRCAQHLVERVILAYAIGGYP